MKNMWSLIGAFVLGVFLGGFASITMIREAVPLRDHIYLTATFIGAFIPILIVMWFWFLSVARQLEKGIGEKGGRIFTQVLSFLLVAEVILFIFVAGFYFTAIA